MSELLASHPGLNVALGLCLRDAGALLDHGAKLNLVLDRRQIEVGHKALSLLGVLHVTLLARDRVGALAALESEHDDSPGKSTAEGRANSRRVLASRCFPVSSIWPRSRIMQHWLRYATRFIYRSPSETRCK